ncbi:hypothetical protein Micbo1qcDRAFT_164738 [Microdochium bolleyi]|uniref:Uncharacterized protein n=1 Tax=Microdochium bolleyi TaxID=196109 RepID=A0A136IZ03_9PEZI|nr:hypothetical protein Micbo1qcDRAFT_164738 [Microdochium bolleyi]
MGSAGSLWTPRTKAASLPARGSRTTASALPRSRRSLRRPSLTRPRQTRSPYASRRRRPALLSPCGSRVVWTSSCLLASTV